MVTEIEGFVCVGVCGGVWVCVGVCVCVVIFSPPPLPVFLTILLSGRAEAGLSFPRHFSFSTRTLARRQSLHPASSGQSSSPHYTQDKGTAFHTILKMRGQPSTLLKMREQPSTLLKGGDSLPHYSTKEGVPHFSRGDDSLPHNSR